MKKRLEGESLFTVRKIKESGEGDGAAGFCR